MVEWGLGRRIEEKLSYVIFSSTNKIKNNRRGSKNSEAMKSPIDAPNQIYRKISIERFERICKNSEFNVLEKTSYLFNPIYEYKFGIKPKKQWGLIAGIPYLRNYLIMGMYYLVEGKK
jgi:hypothetical protein